MAETQPDAWAIVELMGHVRIAGRLTEEEKFGSKMGRLDIPSGPKKDCIACKGTGIMPALEMGDILHPEHACRMPDCNGFVTQYFGGGSVYRITFVTEEVARHVSKSNSPAPVSSWDFPKRLAASLVVSGETDDDEMDDRDLANFDRDE